MWWLMPKWLLWKCRSVMYFLHPTPSLCLGYTDTHISTSDSYLPSKMSQFPVNKHVCLFHSPHNYWFIGGHPSELCCFRLHLPSLWKAGPTRSSAYSIVCAYVSGDLRVGHRFFAHKKPYKPQIKCWALIIGGFTNPKCHITDLQLQYLAVA